MILVMVVIIIFNSDGIKGRVTKHERSPPERLSGARITSLRLNWINCDRNAEALQLDCSNFLFNYHKDMVNF